MANAYVATLEGDYSDIVLGRVKAFGDIGWNFEEVDMTWAVDATGKGTLVAGLVVGADGTPLATAADAADAFGVLVDRKVLPGVEQWNEGVLEAGDVVPMVLAVRGCTFNANRLVTADGIAADAATIAALVKNGNQVTTKIVGTEFIGSVL